MIASNRLVTPFSFLFPCIRVIAAAAAAALARLTKSH
jgi:hypothetical protein